jgi:amidase
MFFSDYSDADMSFLVIGKANLSEWANFKASNSTNGWSAVGGQTQSSYVVGGFKAGGDPCGSSSGSGVGVASGFAPISIGTETDGSIICPSERAALYGLKPTVGLASRSGIIPIAHSQDSPGPMAKSAYDVAMLLTIIAGFDARDTASKFYACAFDTSLS